MAGRRGRETALDMVRTLVIITVVILPLWYFGQGSPADRKRIRPVDPAPALSDFVADTHGPVPVATPAGFVCTVQAYDVGSHVVRIGYVTAGRYLEFSGAQGTSFLSDATGKAVRTGTVQVGSVAWQEFTAAGGAVSLVRTVGPVTVLVGGVRATATLPQLELLAAQVR